MRRESVPCPRGLRTETSVALIRSQFCQLAADDYTGPETPAIENKTWARIQVRRMREAPAPFKYKGRYYFITSACTGWKPNEADYAAAENILGPWQLHGNPCVGTNANITFGTQSTFALPAPGNPGGFIFMADRWKPEDLSDSSYVWLPFIVKDDGSFNIDGASVGICRPFLNSDSHVWSSHPRKRPRVGWFTGAATVANRQ